jgi:trimethylamine:corrinoid methyltransferase-like protein
MLNGIQPKEDFPALSRYQELLNQQHMLASEHTRRYFKEQHYMPGKVIDRASAAKWEEQGKPTLGKHAGDEIERLVNDAPPSSLSRDVKNRLTAIMENEARRCGMDKLPEIDEK